MPKKLKREKEREFLNKFLSELITTDGLNREIGLINKQFAISEFDAYCKKHDIICTPLGPLLERNAFFPNYKCIKKTPCNFAICLAKLQTVNKKFNEKYLINQFLIQMHKKKLLDSNGLMLRQIAIAEFDTYCRSKNITFNHLLGKILERNKYLRTYECYEKHPISKKKTKNHYQINLDKLNLNARTCQHNENALIKSEYNVKESFEKITPYTNGIELHTNEIYQAKEPVVEKHEYDEASEKELSYCKSFKQNINIYYSPSIMSCRICQENFQTKRDFDNHLKENHLADLNRNDYANNEGYLNGYQDFEMDPYFKISFCASRTTYNLRFKIIYCKENISVLNISTIKDGEFVELKYKDKEQYFYGNQNWFSVGITQPVFVIFKDANDCKIDEHHFLVFDQFIDVIGTQLKSLTVLQRAELPYKKIPQNLPNDIMVSCASTGFCDSALKKISTEVRNYIEDKSRVLTDNNFINVLTTLLAMEDQYIINLYRKFNQKNVIIKGFKGEYSISMNLPKELKMEEIIKPFDNIVIKLKKDVENNWLGQIWNVGKNVITFQCRDANLCSEIADIEFLPMRLTLRYQYCALSFLPPKLRHVLFPINNLYKYQVSNISLNINNESIKENPEQLQAVMNIVEPSNKQIPYIIFGPPGTGKTTTLVECIIQLIKSNTNNKILITSGSNAACNEVAKRLTKILNYTNADELILLRIFSAAAEQQSQALIETDPLLFQASNHVHNDHFYPSLDTISEYRIIICTLAVVGKYVSGGLRDGYFSHIFIDEAAASTEPEALVGISKVLSPKSHLILSGDTKQLGAVIFSNRAKELGLGKSLMERLLERDCYKTDENGRYDNAIQTRLVRNFRTHKKIIHISNHLYYDDKLIPSARKELTHWALGWSKLPNKDFPIIFHDVQGTCLVNSSETSSYNLKERNIVLDYVRHMMLHKINGRKINESDIGIISPYKKQYTLIKEDLNKLNLSSIETGSVEIFQGKEKPIIIISMVKSFKNVGFLNEDKRINVMLSRPQALLIIIGNSITLNEIPAFNFVIEYCKENNCFINNNKNNYNNQIIEVQQKFNRLNLSKN